MRHCGRLLPAVYWAVADAATGYQPRALDFWASSDDQHLGFAWLASVGHALWLLAVVNEYLGVGLGTAAFTAFIARESSRASPQPSLRCLRLWRHYRARWPMRSRDLSLRKPVGCVLPLHAVGDPRHDHLDGVAPWRGEAETVGRRHGGAEMR